jgi:hypothetical protein
MAHRRVHHAGLHRSQRARLATASGILLATGALAVSGVHDLRPVANSLAANPCHTNPLSCLPSPTPTCNAHDADQCASPSPSIIVISPVAPDPPSPQTVPGYLIGLTPSPSESPSDAGVVGAPLGGGSTTNQPSPGGGGGAASSEKVSTGGPPVPLLLAGLVVVAIVAGFVIFRFAPRGKKVPVSKDPPPITFTPYGSEAPTANLLDPTVNRPPRDK